MTRPNAPGQPAGTAARLVGTDVAALYDAALYDAATALLDDRELYASMSSVINPFGDGKAADRIVSRLCADL